MIWIQRQMDGFSKPNQEEIQGLKKPGLPVTILWCLALGTLSLECLFLVCGLGQEAPTSVSAALGLRHGGFVVGGLTLC